MVFLLTVHGCSCFLLVLSLVVGTASGSVSAVDSVGVADLIVARATFAPRAKLLTRCSRAVAR